MFTVFRSIGSAPMTETLWLRRRLRPSQPAQRSFVATVVRRPGGNRQGSVGRANGSCALPLVREDGPPGITPRVEALGFLGNDRRRTDRARVDDASGRLGVATFGIAHRARERRGDPLLVPLRDPPVIAVNGVPVRVALREGLQLTTGCATQKIASTLRRRSSFTGLPISPRLQYGATRSAWVVRQVCVNAA